MLIKVKKQLKKTLGKEKLTKIHDRFTKNKFLGFLIGLFFGSNLKVLSIIYHTDKYSHGYIPRYQFYFQKIRRRKNVLLEIGVGGYKFPDKGGASLRMWKRYFPFSKIFAIDIYDKSKLEERRIKIYQGSQVDFSFLENVLKKINTPPNIIIDDGSHINEHVIESFKYLFPSLKNGGYYIVEDTQTSYWDNCGGDSENLDNPDTSMNFFKKLTDSLNYKEYQPIEHVPDYFEKHIDFIHFYSNQIVIKKKSTS